MDVNTNRVYDWSKLSEEYKNELATRNSVLPVPKKYQGEANRILNGNAEAQVDSIKSPLAKWAEKVRTNLGQNP